MPQTTSFTGLTQNQLIYELTKNLLKDMPVRVIRVDVMEDENLRIQHVEVVNGEVHIVVDRHAKVCVRCNDEDPEDGGPCYGCGRQKKV